MYYSRVGMLAIILHVIINASTLFKKHKTSSPVPLRYRVFLFSVLFFYLADFLWGILIEQKSVLPAYILSVAFFATMGLSVFFWIRFIQVFLNRRNIWSTLLSYVAWALLIIELSSLIANIFLPLMFTFTPEGEYVPGIARSLILYVQIVLFAMVSVYTLIRAFRMEDRDSFYSSFNELVEKNMSSGGPVVSAGMCILDEEHTGFDAVFEHADLLMYERKKELKSRA